MSGHTPDTRASLEKWILGVIALVAIALDYSLQSVFFDCIASVVCLRVALQIALVIIWGNDRIYRIFCRGPCFFYWN